MGSHRAERRGVRRRPSETLKPAASATSGRRVAGRPTSTPAIADANPVRTDATTVFHDFDATAELPLLTAQPPGRRKAVKHAASRGSLIKGLPSAPVLVGVAALAVSAGGALTVSSPGLVDAEPTRVSAASAMSGETGIARANLLSNREAVISRDSRRDALDDAAEAELVAEAEQQTRQRNAALAELRDQVEAQAAKIELNLWVLPLSGYRITATYGEYGLWSSYHTGLDFAAPSGTALVAMANATVTSVGYDGAYGNKTVLTLDDGTELWYCHQNSMNVTEGDVVQAGDVIGSVGSTGNVTGPHLHLEVRPGGGDPVDPYEAMRVHGLTP
ncbi:M23 family metallopeptidase [Nocardioides ferulae]|uniref:M23 family metallopeptidase n=1 Tax=Nocardioides ferulae TaxID=2340821 RepID=UPI0019815911|nr:M23 family metallopeptidase [Nocardioides ferulae]